MSWTKALKQWVSGIASEQADPGQADLPYADLSSLRIVSATDPEAYYPAMSRHLGERGRVRLSFVVEANGRVSHVAVRKRSGHERLDEAAKQFVHQLRFQVAQLPEARIRLRSSIEIEFLGN